MNNVNYDDLFVPVELDSLASEKIEAPNYSYWNVSGSS